MEIYTFIKKINNIAKEAHFHYHYFQREMHKRNAPLINVTSND